MTAKEARQITAAAKKTAISGIYDKIRIAANEGKTSIVFEGNCEINTEIVDELTDKGFEISLNKFGEDVYLLNSINWKN